MHIKLYGMKHRRNCKQKFDLANTLATGVGFKGQIKLQTKGQNNVCVFLSGRVADQIKRNKVYNSMQAKPLPLHILSIPSMRSRSKHFSEGGHVAYSKLNEMKHRTNCKQTFRPYTHPGLWGWV